MIEQAQGRGLVLTGLTRLLEDFLTGRELALPLDWDDRHAARRRQHRIDAIPGRAVQR